MGNAKGKINQHIRLVQNTTCFTYLLTLLKITALPVKNNNKIKKKREKHQQKPAKFNYSVDATIKSNRFNFHEVVGEKIKTLLMLSVAVQTFTVEAVKFIHN